MKYREHLDYLLQEKWNILNDEQNGTEKAVPFLLHGQLTKYDS